MALTKREIYNAIIQLQNQRIQLAACIVMAKKPVDHVQLFGTTSDVRPLTYSCVAHRKEWDFGELSETIDILGEAAREKLAPKHYKGYERAITYMSQIADDARDITHKLRQHAETQLA